VTTTVTLEQSRTLDLDLDLALTCTVNLAPDLNMLNESLEPPLERIHRGR
jgi:hypothetical protein